MSAGFRTRLRADIIAGIFALSVAVGPALANDQGIRNRYAIVIGNNDYVSVGDLPNAIADSELIATFLEDQGFHILRYTDVDKADFERLLRDATRLIKPGSDTVFYFAGHGMQVAGGNYLVPVDADLDDPLDTPFETVSLTNIVEILGRQSRIKVFIIDSCRDNPFGVIPLVTGLQGNVGDTALGFAPLTAPLNSLLSFSTSPGAVAYDGSGGNSPFTASLVEIGNQGPAEPIGTLLNGVRRKVSSMTNGLQVPWDSSTLVDDFAFALPVTLASATAPSGPVDAAGAGAPPLRSVGDNTAPTADNGATVNAISFTAVYSETLAIGAFLAPRIGVGTTMPIAVVRRPSSGNLGIDVGNGVRLGLQGSSLGGAMLANLVYAPQRQETRSLAIAPFVDDVVTDTIEFRTGETLWKVAVQLSPDPCDTEAGDLLDPDGAVAGRYPNEIVPATAIAACTDAIARNPDEGRFHYQLGRALVADGNLNVADPAFRRAIDLGHTRAWYGMASLLAGRAEQTGGIASGQYPDEAMSLLREGANRGDPYAYHTLGLQLLYFGTDAADENDGFALLSRSVELGHTFSFNALGTLFLDETSAYFNAPRGLRYWQESAERGDIYGINNMGIVYRDGLADQPKDAAQAAIWFEQASVGGHPTAPANIGRLWVEGRLGTVDQYAQAIRWYDIGLRRGDAWAGANAAWLIANGRVSGLQDSAAAVRAAKAAVLTNAKAAEAAREVLAALPAPAVEGGILELLGAIDPPADVNGGFDTTAKDRARNLLRDRAVELPAEDDGVGWILALAEAFWMENPFRIDLN